MDQDRSSVKSNDSGGGFEFVQNSREDQPELKIANNGDLEELKLSLSEVLKEEKTMEEQGKREDKEADTFFEAQAFVGHDDGAEFNQISYLGAANINAPKSEAEIHRNMAILNREQDQDQCIRVSIRVPSCSAGSVVLIDAATMQIITSYEVQRILFYAHGIAETEEAACFAFTWSHGHSQESAIFQCHVFRCDIPEAVRQVSTCFAKAFMRSLPRPPPPLVCDESQVDLKPSSLQSPVSTMSELFTFELTMEIKEEDSKGGYYVVPKDRSQFKLRANTEKQLCFTVHQVSSVHQRILHIERCFGVLVCPGRNVRHADMRLLEMVSMGSDSPSNKYVITGQWDSNDTALEKLNVVEDPSAPVKSYVTVAIDLVIRGIQEPVRLLLETKVKVFPKNERFWNLTKRQLVQQFYLNLKELPASDTNEPQFEVISVDTSGEIDRTNKSLGISLSGLMSLQLVDPLLSPREEKDEDFIEDELSDNDEPMLSGTGDVSKDCSEALLEQWSDALSKWTQTGSKPKQLNHLVCQGIPHALRAEVWQRLAGYSDEVMEKYRLLIAKESSCESVIQRDINRTFPAHDFFKKAGGLGQDSLFRLSKAYAVYDEEVGYCQGLSFLAAALLLHMPEEQAFCVLVQIMYRYKLRDLFKDGFENLNMRLYQLSRLMEDQVQDLWQHFQDKGVEEHMYGSQWFLTLFTAKFPLHMVFHILDVFLLQGIDTLFLVALALLMSSKKELLQLDFEGILKYFRVNLPKKYRTPKASSQLMKKACSLNVKKLHKYEKEFLTFKNAQDKADQYGNELERLKSELQMSEEDRLRLESEVTQVKDMIKREVQRANEERERNEAIIAEYKQICSQLSQRLEEQVEAGKDKESQGQLCPKCKGDSVGTWVDPLSVDADPRLVVALQRVRELELELAQTKLEHVEAACRNQDLTHQLNAASSELQASKGSWLHKTLSSIKEAAKKDGSTLLPARRESKDGMARDAA
ncbi:rab GTPase-activating protein 1-like isoform X2 [Neocloeon triangulifer]|uniref:rab GTPase-activating protein 1-like isoform X2 n=1 Tax=Neocloeon triangulifer TaxID=2078957 RepID=UPI00286F4D1C|nr:rab GTPase-activating protein 1-like isoform X2 [Neocloeon triangulifer]